jgi:hypothetical protein
MRLAGLPVLLCIIAAARGAGCTIPGAYVAGISPDPVWLFHSPVDADIPCQNGSSLFIAAEDQKNCEAFNGTHGITPEVDSIITGDILTF